LGGTVVDRLAGGLLDGDDAVVDGVVDGLGLGAVEVAAPDAVPAAAGSSAPLEPPEKSACTVSATSTMSAMTEASNNKRRRQ
jgi:hypothetical protein